MRPFIKILMLTTALTLTGCSDSSSVFTSSPSSGTQQNSAKSGGYYKVGNPYQVAGIWYYPKEDYAYTEVGVSSWYGADFHNGVTANGELYDMHEMTAAHRTLPLPSIVRVTNLQNGRSVVLRVNDRGPFVNDRIIDVSMRAAQMLGFKDQGTTQVQVELLPEESKALKADLLQAQNSGSKVASAAAVGLESEIIADASTPAAPTNLGQPKALPRLANQPPTMLVDAPLVAETTVAKQDADKYNDWNEDLTKPQAQRSAFTAEEPKKVVPAPKPIARKPASSPAQKVVAPSKPVVLTTTSVAPGYYVQVGAFGNEENAEKMRLKASKFGSALIVPVSVNGKSLYRVRLGPANAKKALEIMDQVSKSGFADARLVEEKGSAASAGKRLDNAF